MDRLHMRLLIDEHLPRRLGHIFEQRGHEVEYVTVGAKDPEIVATADTMHAIVVTSDRGFRNTISRNPARDKGRFKQVGLILVSGETNAAITRLRQRVELIEYLFATVQQEEDKRLIVEVREHAIHAEL